MKTVMGGRESLCHWFSVTCRSKHSALDSDIIRCLCSGQQIHSSMLHSNLLPFDK